MPDRLLPLNSINDLHARIRAAEMAAQFADDHEDAGLVEQAIAAAAIFHIAAEDMGVDPLLTFAQILNTLHPTKEAA